MESSVINQVCLPLPSVRDEELHSLSLTPERTGTSVLESQAVLGLGLSFVVLGVVPNLYLARDCT